MSRNELGGYNFSVATLIISLSWPELSGGKEGFVFLYFVSNLIMAGMLIYPTISSWKLWNRFDDLVNGSSLDDSLNFLVEDINGCVDAQSQIPDVSSGSRSKAITLYRKFMWVTIMACLYIGVTFGLYVVLAFVGIAACLGGHGRHIKDNCNQLGEEA